MTGPILLLGGTSEARALAAALVAAGVEVISTLAGRVRDPALPAGEVRIGGFSTGELDGTSGLAAYLRDHRITTVVDATHPFAATISTHAAVAAQRSGVRLLRLERPGWGDHPDAPGWTWVDSAAAAVAAGARAERPFLSTGRQSLGSFLPWADREVTARVVDRPDFDLPARWRVIRSRGPYDLPAERAVLGSARADLLVTKDSGGTYTAAKLDAARELAVPVVVIRRPAGPPGIPTRGSVEELLPALLGGRSAAARG